MLREFANFLSQSLNVHHRASSIPHNEVRYDYGGGWQWRDSSRLNLNIIERVMVGGLEMEDGFEDVKVNINQTESTIDRNAGLVAVLVVVSSANIIKEIFSHILPPGNHIIFFCWSWRK